MHEGVHTVHVRRRGLGLSVRTPIFSVKDRPQGPPTANSHQAPTAKHQPPPIANRQPPTANHCSILFLFLFLFLFHMHRDRPAGCPLSSVTVLGPSAPIDVRQNGDVRGSGG